MAQFGAGPEFAAQCPRIAVPDGWRVWTTSDGPIPAALLERTRALVADTSIVLGATESYPLPGVTTLLRVEPHPWAQDTSGDFVPGCFRGVTVYLPVTAPAMAPPPKVDEETGIGTTAKVIASLTVVSLAVGIIATVRQLRKQ